MLDALACVGGAAPHCEQLHHFFSEEDGRELFGDQSPSVLQALDAARSDIESVATRILDNNAFEKANQQVEQFAAEFPIAQANYTRVSMLESAQAESLAGRIRMPALQLPRELLDLDPATRAMPQLPQPVLADALRRKVRRGVGSPDLCLFPRILGELLGLRAKPLR